MNGAIDPIERRQQQHRLQERYESASDHKKRAYHNDRSQPPGKRCAPVRGRTRSRLNALVVALIFRNSYAPSRQHARLRRAALKIATRPEGYKLPWTMPFPGYLRSFRVQFASRDTILHSAWKE
jgi:hypothetical protein